MISKIDVKNSDEETKRFIDFLNRDKRKTIFLVCLCAILMLTEALFSLFMDMVTIIIVTFIFTSIVHIYVLHRLDVYKINLSNILSAVSNNMTIKEWANMKPEQIIKKDLKVAKLNWRSLKAEYTYIFASCFVCMAVLYIHVLMPIFFK